MATDNAPYYLVGVLKKAIEIIETISERKELTIADLVDILGQDRNAVNRIVLTLQHLGYLCRLENRKYTLTLKMFQIGSSALDQNQIIRTVKSYMKELSDCFGQTVCLGQSNEKSVVTVDLLNGTLPINFSARVGDAAPIQTTSMGKSILAAMPDDKLDQLLKTLKFTKYTDNSILNATDLKKDIEKIRRRGFAEDAEEWARGVHCLGIPIYGPNGVCMWGMSVSGPASSFTPGQIKAISVKLLEVKASLAREMGLDEKGLPF